MKILIVDDSALMRRYLSEMLGEVVGIHTTTARDGIDALEVIERENPDVVTLDINMPEMDGLTCLSHIMTRFPRPVVMLSSLTEAGAMATFEALEMGAVDYIAKPGGTVSLNIKEIRSQILIKVRTAYRQRHLFNKKAVLASKPVPSVGIRTSDTHVRGIISIASSTGGPSALEKVLPFLPANLPLPVVVCQHMPGSFTGVFAQRLDGRCALNVVEVNKAMELKAGTIYIGQGDADCMLSLRDGKPYLVTLPASASFNWHPSASRFLQSVHKYFPAQRTLSAILTGMGDDGSREALKLYQAGGITMAEREIDCAVFGMPKALIELSGAGSVLGINEMSGAIVAGAEKIAKLGVIETWV
ncbi:chemotaxis protein CheB [Catenovulum sediminis]|uniref:Protein-glutamate methylesterase/protein-glutamine glutaminase n=2 Tax=Catenovulum sediminis TaxID=1740262 RepID=A0ABV1RMY3_9ALTE